MLTALPFQRSSLFVAAIEPSLSGPSRGVTSKNNSVVSQLQWPTVYKNGVVGFVSISRRPKGFRACTLDISHAKLARL